jgi:hypothetical protein
MQMREQVIAMMESIERLVETDPDGRVFVRLGLVVTLYFPRGHTLEKREAVLECFRDYLDLCGEHLRWWVIEGRRFSPVAKLINRDLAPYLLSPKIDQDPERTWGIFWHGGEHMDDASDYRISAFGQSKFESDLDQDLSFLSATFPLVWLPERREELLRLALLWCERLQPLHGYGGAGIVDAASDGLATIYQKRVYALAKRHPGLEVDYPLDHALWTQKGIKGGNWITVLADVFVAHLGGVDALRSGLGQPFKIYEYRGGVMIVAGENPEIGDRNRNLDTPLYRRLARVLRPIRVVFHPGVHDWEGGFDKEEFESWLARFDD